MRKKNTETRFACACNGCRNYPTNPAQIWHQDQLAGKTQGYFFSRDTMKMFKSRVSDFKPVGISPSKIESLAVIVSSIFGIEGAVRYYEVVVICPYGNVWRERNEEGLVKYDNLRQARKSKSWNFDMPAPVCECHGCILDREEVSA